MNRSGGLGNKLIYLAVIVVMLLPLYLLGQPATDATSNSGGELTRMRGNLNLSEANLGEIDPASETMKLASLGLRGVAATLLWHKSNEYKKLHEWDRLSATLNQIANLQPHFENVWEHQAHNLSYNVSVEFDDYRQRYAWVKKGMDFLTEGVRKNRTAPRLVWYTGWFYGQKLGMSDEKTQFRELFREDEPFHAQLKDENIDVDSPDARGPDGRPDNWLVGRLWLNRGYDLVDGGVPLVDKTPVTFFEVGPKWRIQHATAIEQEGVLDDRAKGAWERAADDWYGYGTRPLSTTDGYTVQLAKINDLYQLKEELVAQFKEVAGPTLERIRAQRRAALSDAAVKALDTPAERRTREQMMIVSEVEGSLEPDFVLVSQQAPKEAQLKALQIAAKIRDIDNRITKSQIYRDQMNYDYWQLRSEAEQDDLMIEARRLLYEAQQLYEDSDLDGEIAKYELAFDKWAQLYEKYPSLIEDVTGDEVMEAINRYRVATDQSDMPEDFPLKVFYDLRLAAEGTTGEDYTQALGGGPESNPSLPSFDLSQPYTGRSQDEPQTEPDPSAPEAADSDTPEPDATSTDANGTDAAGNQAAEENEAQPAETKGDDAAGESGTGNKNSTEPTDQPVSGDPPASSGDSGPEAAGR
jgi:hypothetical protein